MLKKQKEKSCDPMGLLHVVELENLRKEARYCFLDAGPGAEDALQQLNAIDFTAGSTWAAESQKARYDWIDPSSCKLLDAESERQCLQKLDRLIELVERVQQAEETQPEIKPITAAPSLERAEKTGTVFRDLDTLRKLKSLSQSQAAEALGISPRAIRELVHKEQLSKTAKGRIACDAKFIEQFHFRHSPLGK